MRGAGTNGPASTAQASSFLNCPDVGCGLGGRQQNRNGLPASADRWPISPRPALFTRSCTSFCTPDSIGETLMYPDADMLEGEDENRASAST